MHGYRELEVWQLAMDTCSDVYELTSRFPGDERFGLTNQLRRAAVSIPSNIAAGNGRGSIPDYIRFLATTAEVGTQTELALRLGYASQDQADFILRKTVRIHQMLNRLITSLKTKHADNGLVGETAPLYGSEELDHPANPESRTPNPEPSTSNEN